MLTGSNEGDMIESDPNLVISNLSRHVTKDGVSVEVSIYRLERDNDWFLEVVSYPPKFGH
jgi:hypothetical protein